MTRSSKKMVKMAAEVLNKHLTADNDVTKVLTDEDKGTVVLDLINEILVAGAEGGRLVAAVESSGALLGFVPRSDIPIPERPSAPSDPSPPASSPEGE